MIPFDFEYYRAETLEEAIDVFNHLEDQGKKPIYYGGGTEFISMARVHNVYADAVIDIKAIPDCNIYGYSGDELVIGSAVTLTEISLGNLFPLLSTTVKRIADHTIQGKITLGGNLLGTIIYKESSLPLLVSNSQVVIADTKGKKRMPIVDLLEREGGLGGGGFLSQIIIKKDYTSCPYYHAKRTKNEKIDYPLTTAVALKDNGRINIAFSGLCEGPFRSPDMEDILNNNTISREEKIEKAIKNTPQDILNDIRGSAQYRKFVLHTILAEIYERLGVEG